MTTFYATVNLNNLFKFLKLRLDEHTQKETRVIAYMMSLSLKKVAPLAYDAFMKYIFNSFTLTIDELRCILNNSDLKSNSSSQVNEFKLKKETILKKIKEKNLENESVNLNNVQYNDVNYIQ
jgi:thymidylate synthase (FAD)